MLGTVLGTGDTSENRHNTTLVNYLAVNPNFIHILGLLSIQKKVSLSSARNNTELSEWSQQR